MSTFWYCLKQGIVNICRNILFSLASIATISACIFLFCLFFALTANVRHGAKEAQETVGITVFFDSSLPQEEIRRLGEELGTWPQVRELRFISAAEAWDTFKKVYFEGMEELAEGFEDDNPLADSSSYEIFLNNIEDQDMVVERLQSMEGIRKVRYSEALAAGFTDAGRILGLLSAMIIIVLLLVSVFLISNTISVAAAFRRRENEIMRYIGAANLMIRGPFVVEGFLLGVVGALIPLAGICVLYQRGISYLTENYGMVTGMVEPLPLELLFPAMSFWAMALGAGVGVVVSFVTIHRHLRV